MGPLTFNAETRRASWFQGYGNRDDLTRYISLSKKSSLFDGGNFWQARPYFSKTRKSQVECIFHYNILNSSRYKVDRFSK